MTDPCLDLSIQHLGLWFADKGISIPNSQIVAGEANSISVTLASHSGATGHANLYYGTPGTGPDPCVIDPQELIVVNTDYNSLLPPVPVPTGGTAPDNGAFEAPSILPSPVMIVAKAVLDQLSSCQGSGETPGWDATSPGIGAHRFAVVTGAMVSANLFVLLPPDEGEDQRNTAFAMSVTAGRGRDGYGRRVRTILRAVVIGTERREKHLDTRRRDLILDYESEERRGMRRDWIPASSVRLALGKEHLLLEGPWAQRASLGHAGPISPQTMRHLTSGFDSRSERDIQIELSLDPGEVRQALVEMPIPPPGAFHVVRLLHQEAESQAILQERTFIVEPDFGELRQAPYRAA
jgi:hypothetical protein